MHRQVHLCQDFLLVFSFEGINEGQSRRVKWPLVFVQCLECLMDLQLEHCIRISGLQPPLQILSNSFLH